MKTPLCFRAAALTLFLATAAQAQTMYNVQYWMEQGNYTEAAKCLRPLADGGNAEAQTLAAQLFFEGKGVTKNEAQGVKYATQAAKQGHEEAVMLLANHYDKQGQKQKAVGVLKEYTNLFPQLLKSAPGLWLGYAYILGDGVTPDSLKACEILDQQENLGETLIKNTALGEPYWNCKAKQAGVSSLSAYYQKTRNPQFREWVLGIMDVLDSEKQKVWYELWRNEQANGYKPIAAIVSHWAETGKGTKRDLFVAKYLAWQAADQGDAYGKQRYQYLLRNTEFVEGEIRPEGIVIDTYGPKIAVVMQLVPYNSDWSTTKVASVEFGGHLYKESGYTSNGLTWYRATNDDYSRLIQWMKTYDMEVPSGFVWGDGLFLISNEQVKKVRTKLKNSDYSWRLPAYLVTIIKR